MVPKSPSLGISKITPPRLYKVLERRRLFERLESALDAKLVLIMGQGAQGKSTLAASYLEWTDRPYAWLNLGPEDSDPVNLFLALIQAVQRAFNQPELAHLANMTAESFGPREPIPRYREWVLSLYERIPSGLQIGFDGLDSLSIEAPSFLLLRILVEEAPDNVRLLMMSRTIPSFEVERWEMIHQAVVIDNAELTFTPGEEQLLLKESLGVSINAGQLEAIHRLTEGWAGGLILISNVLKQSADFLETISESDLNGFGHKIFRYFSEQIFSTLTRTMQDFLLKTSVFDVVQPSILNEYLDQENSEQFVEELFHRHLFVSFYHLPDNNRLFRYHKLFLDFLRSKLETVYKPSRKRDLYLKAARLLEENGDDESAYRLYLQAKEYRPAAVVLERIGLDVLKEGREEDVAQWLEALPAILIHENPWLLTYQCITRRFTAPQSNIEDLSRAVDLFQEQQDLRGGLLAISLLVENSFYLLVDGRGFLEKAEALLELVNAEEYPYESSLLYRSMGLTYSVYVDPRKGLWAYQNAYALAERAKMPFLRVEIMINMIQPLFLLGDFAAGDELVQRIERQLTRVKSNELRAFYHMAYCWYSAFGGELNRAAEMGRRAADEVIEHGIMYLMPFSLLANLFCSVLQDDHDAADELASRALEFITRQKDAFSDMANQFFMGLSAYRRKEYARAVEILDRFLEFVLHTIRTETLILSARIIKGLLDYHINEPPQWEDDLEKAGAYARQIRSWLFRVQYHLVKALLCWKRGDADQTRNHLEAGLGLAEEKSYTYFFTFSPVDLVRVLALAVELRVDPAMNYVTHLLSGRYADQAVGELERLSRHRQPTVRKAAKEIKTAIYLKDRPRLGVKTLGGFQVRRGGIPIPESDWKGARSKLLLKTIIAHGPRRGVSKEIIIDLFWPEASSAAAENNFKTVLHRLRKALEPDISKEYGFSYIQLKDNMLSLTDLIEDIDLESFLALADRGEARAREGDIRGAQDDYKQALSLYSGEFLPDDRYHPWLTEKREAIAVHYRRVLFNSAQLHETRGDLNKAISAFDKIIEVEPTLEEAYRRLMRLHSRLGRCNQALKTYRLCERNLKDILDVEPEPETLALYQGIKDGAEVL